MVREINQPGLLVVVSGPAGVGKGTVCRQLMAVKPGLELSVSVTTRLPRPGEVDGQDYYYLHRADFSEKIRSGYFLEWAEVHGEYYGTPGDIIKEKIEQGHSVLLEIDVQGALQVKDNYPAAVLIFIAPPALDELMNRIVNRGTETAEQIERRMQTARRELAAYDKYHYLVVNETVADTAAMISAIISAEFCRTDRGAGLPWE